MLQYILTNNFATSREFKQAIKHNYPSAIMSDCTATLQVVGVRPIKPGANEHVNRHIPDGTPDFNYTLSYVYTGEREVEKDGVICIRLRPEQAAHFKPGDYVCINNGVGRTPHDNRNYYGRIMDVKGGSLIVIDNQARESMIQFSLFERLAARFKELEQSIIELNARLEASRNRIRVRVRTAAAAR